MPEKAADPAVGDGRVRGSAGQAAELLLEDDVAAGVDALASEPPLDEDEEPDESEEDEELDDEEELFAGLLLDDEPRLSLR